jgi:hypothetical protein
MQPLRPVRQPDGKLVVVAPIDRDHALPQTALARFTRTGRPDASFGRGGLAYDVSNDRAPEPFAARCRIREPAIQDTAPAWR